MMYVQQKLKKYLKQKLLVKKIKEVVKQIEIFEDTKGII